jgi:hypothetical protein
MIGGLIPSNFSGQGRETKMDTGPEYIKMCEKAEEIQEYKAYNPMSFYYHKNLKGSEVCEGRNLISIATSVWLPRQDQLQEIFLNGLGPIHSTDLAGMFGKFADRLHKSEQFLRDYSMEQLWLAFVMKEKYNKVWDGEDWVKIIDNHRPKS